LFAIGQQTCPTDPPYSDLAYDILKNIDRSQVPTGILYESVFPLADIYAYTGVLNSTDTSYTGHFLQAYAEIYQSANNNTGMKHYQQLYEDIDNFHPDRKYHHPIGIIDYDFNTIHPDAVNNNLLSVSNNQLFDVTGRPSSPYVSEKVVIAGALMTEDYPCFYPGTHYFRFDNNFVLSNSGFSLSQVTHLEAIYDGTTVFNGPVSGLTNFTLDITVGNDDKNALLILRLTVGGQQKHYIISACQVAIEPPTDCKGTHQLEITGYPFDGGYTDEKGEPIGEYSELGVATIYYSDSSCADKKLRRPLIFIDGFDPGNTQHHETIWKDRLNAEFQETGNPFPTQLGAELLSLGYDIIILDQKKPDSGQKYNRGGTGLVENVGLVLAKLLDSLYTLHGTTMEEDFVVIGASMGGINARFGLAWMEANNKPHHTRLFISCDSPQNGAQIPIGLQQMVDRFTRYGGLALVPSIRNTLHYSNAAKQMLLHHSDTNSESVQAHPFYNMLRNNLAAVGDYPSQCRNVAIVNGNRNGIKKTLPPASSPDIPPIFDKGELSDLGIKRRGLLGLCNTNLCYKLRTQVYAQTASNRSITMEFRLNHIGLLNLASFTLPFVPFRKYAIAENGTSYDIAPGARLGFGLERATEKPIPLISWLAVGPLKVSNNTLPFTNFVPTVSSSAYILQASETPNIYKNFNGVGISKCNGTTKFDTVYAPATDMQHVSIDEYIASAFREEVYNLKSKSYCSGDCPDYINLTSSPTTTDYKAAKAINLQPNFIAQSGAVFGADIGCINNSTSNKPILTPLPVNILSICPFEWDQVKNQVICSTGFTTFKAFVRYLPIGDYAEFSTNGSTWFRANIGDNGYSVNINANPGQSQVFYSRPHSNPSNVLQGFLAHCP
jgi:hypothetical protein